MAGGGTCEEKRGTGKISQRVYGLEIEDSGIEEGDKCLCVGSWGGIPVIDRSCVYGSEHVKK